MGKATEAPLEQVYRMLEHAFYGTAFAHLFYVRAYNTINAQLHVHCVLMSESGCTNFEAIELL